MILLKMLKEMIEKKILTIKKSFINKLESQQVKAQENKFSRKNFKVNKIIIMNQTKKKVYNNKYNSNINRTQENMSIQDKIRKD